MTIMTPAEFMAQNDSDLSQPGLAGEKMARMQVGLIRHGRMPDSFVVPATCEYIEKLTSITMSAEQLQEMLALYPAEKAKLSRFTSSDFAHCDLVKNGEAVKESFLIANVVAHFFGRTLWPKASDAVDIKAFTKKIQRAALVLGYTVSGCSRAKLTA